MSSGQAAFKQESSKKWRRNVTFPLHFFFTLATDWTTPGFQEARDAVAVEIPG